MSIISKMKAHKGFCVVGLIELILFLFFIIKLIIPNKTIEFTPDCFVLENGRYVENGVSSYVEIEEHQVMNFFYVDYLSLPAGTYDIYCNYSASGDGSIAYVDIEDDVSGFLEESCNQILTSNVLLEPFYNQVKVKFMLTQATDYLRFKIFYTANGNLKVYSVKLHENHRDELMALFLIIFISSIVDGIWLLKIKRKNLFNDENKTTVVVLTAVVLLSSLALFIPYLVEGHDLRFHLLRIEGIKDSVLTGQLPSKIQPNWLNGNGYAVSVFYGDLFLYIPAFLRLIGFSIHFAYVFYALLVNTATCLISYCCFKGMVKNNRAALIGSAVYTLSLYRFINMYIRSAVGEYTAMTFLPLIVYGIWKIFTDDTEDKRYKYNFIVPVIGYTGLLQTHVISCEIAGIFTIITCLIFIKKVFNKKRFCVLAFIVVLTAVINAGFLVPFISYLGEPVKINLGYLYKAGIQHFGTFAAQLLELFTSYSGLCNTKDQGITGEMPITTGIAVIAGGMFFAYMWYMGRIDKKWKKTGMFCLLTGSMALLMSTVYFPWDTIQKLNTISAKVITSFQFPWRFLTVALVFLTVATVIALKHELEDEKAHIKWFSIVVVLLVVIQSSWLLSGILNNGKVMWAYEESGLDTEYLVGCEYLPGEIETDEYYSRQFAYGSDNISYEELGRNRNIISFSYNNSTDESGYVATSIIYYTGYQAVNRDDGSRLKTYSNDGYLSVKLPPHSSGTYTIRFVQPWYWKLSYIISFVGAGVLAAAMVGYIKEKRGSK